MLSVAGDGAAPFEVRVLDADGTVVESYDSADAGAEGLPGLYDAAQERAAAPSRVAETLLAELTKAPATRLQEMMSSIVDKVHAAPNDSEKAEIIKPLLLIRIEDLREKNKAEIVWPEFVEPFPTGGGVRNAIVQAFKELRADGQIKCTVTPEPGPNQGFGGGKKIRFAF